VNDLGPRFEVNPPGTRPHRIGTSPKYV
jgi:hypothetical protein